MCSHSCITVKVRGGKDPVDNELPAVDLKNCQQF